MNEPTKAPEPVSGATPEPEVEEEKLTLGWSGDPASGAALSTTHDALTLGAWPYGPDKPGGELGAWPYDEPKKSE